jgi:hypothetical protein
MADLRDVEHGRQVREFGLPVFSAMAGDVGAFF